MEKLVDVLRSLDKCAGGKGGCDGCPYDGDGSCKDRLMRDAFGWLLHLENDRKIRKNSGRVSVKKYRAMEEKLEQTEMALEGTRMNLGDAREECRRLECENDDLKILVAASGILERYRPAFEELAKGVEE
jgi:hypothetical protein